MAVRRGPKAFWIWLHRWIGLISCVFLGFAAITGCVMCFIRPLDAALNADLFKQPAVSRPISVTLAVDRYQSLHPELWVRSFPLDVALDRRIPVKVEASVKAQKLGFNQVFLDRATGAEAGRRDSDVAWTRRGAMELLHDVHYTLLAGNPGKYFMGGLALAWLLSNFVGIYLTVPNKAPRWKQWKRMWRFSFKSVTPRLLLDLHRSSGLWLIAPLTALALTSVLLNFFVFYEPAMGHLVPQRPSVFDTKAPFPKGIDGRLGFTNAVEILTAEGSRIGGGWKPATAVYYPARRLYGVAMTDDGTLNYHYLGPMYLFADGASGQVVGTDSPYGGNTGLALIRFLYTVHSGRTAGFVGIALVFLLGLATLEQCLTGIYVWLRKRRFRV